MIENITREDVELLMQNAIVAYNESTDTNIYKFNVWVEDELVDTIMLPSHLAPIYRDNPIFIEVTGNPIFD
jgi:hypothetical protein